MKETIIALLSKGYVRTRKFKLADLARKFYPIRDIARDCETLGVRCLEGHPFWHPDNNNNRIALINDLMRAKLGDVRSSYYHVLVRLETGDGYGIPKPE